MSFLRELKRCSLWRGVSCMRKKHRPQAVGLNGRHGLLMLLVASIGVALPAAMSLPAWAAEEQAVPPRAFVNFDDEKSIKFSPDQADIRVVPADGGHALEIVTKSKDTWPGTFIEPTEGAWDLSLYDTVEMDVTNPEDCAGQSAYERQQSRRRRGEKQRHGIGHRAAQRQGCFGGAFRRLARQAGPSDRPIEYNFGQGDVGPAGAVVSVSGRQHPGDIARRQDAEGLRRFLLCCS